MNDRIHPSTHVLTRGGSVVLALITSVVLGVLVQAADGWLIVYDDAIAQAKKTGRPILANFTGSDWCGWCIKLKNEVFDTKEFKEWAAQEVVLLELDFPQHKEQDPAIKAKNDELNKTYGVGGYPTVLILDAQGKQIGKLGYQAGGPTKWIAEFVRQQKDPLPQPKPGETEVSIDDLLEREVALDVQNEDVYQAIKQMGQRSGVRIGWHEPLVLADEKIPALTISGKQRFRFHLERFSQLTGLTYRIRGNHILVRNQVIDKILERKIILELPQAGVLDVIKQLEAHTGTAIVLDPLISAELVPRLFIGTVNTNLQIFLDTYTAHTGLSYRFVEDEIVVGPSLYPHLEKIMGREVIIDLTNAPLHDAIEQLQNLSGKMAISVDPLVNADDVAAITFPKKYQASFRQVIKDFCVLTGLSCQIDNQRIVIGPRYKGSAIEALLDRKISFPVNDNEVVSSVIDRLQAIIGARLTKDPQLNPERLAVPMWRIGAEQSSLEWILRLICDRGGFTFRIVGDSIVIGPRDIIGARSILVLP